MYKLFSLRSMRLEFTPSVICISSQLLFITATAAQTRGIGKKKNYSSNGIFFYLQNKLTYIGLII